MTLLARAIALLLAIHGSSSAAPVIGKTLAELLADFDARRVPTGILYDRVLPLSPIDEHDGGAFEPAATHAAFRQMADEIRRASLAPPPWSLRDLDAAARDARGRGVVPVALLDFEYERLREDALGDGSLVVRGSRLAPGIGDPLRRERVFAAAPLVERTHRGERVVFEVAALRLSGDPDAPREIAFDPDDGLGFRAVRAGGRVTAEYRSEGRKTGRVRVTTADGETRRAGFSFDVLRLGTPAPDDTLAITATIPHQGELGTGSAYVLLAPGHVGIENPAIVFEGFDLDNGMHWEELYALLNQQSLLESLRALGFDAVVLDFADATAPIQENAFVGLELIEQVRAMSGGGNLVLVGASMGGLVARYALAYAETHAIDHDVRTFVSFDVPHGGATIPLGIQYWLAFFASESADAAALLAALDSPAARQMLVYHHTTPPGATGEPDPEHAAFLADLAALGDWPAAPRLAGIANGTGSQANQGFLPGAQIIRWEYDSFLVDVTGNVWAVPDGASQTIFRGMIDFIALPPDEMTVAVSGTLPWDGAPGGYRGSMAQMDSVQAPFGNILALHPNHCFIPTISALALDHTTDPFHDVEGDPQLPMHTPFDAFLYQTENEGHVSVNAATAQWLLDEITGAVTGAGEIASAPRTRSLLWSVPNPFRAGTTIAFSLAEPAPVSLRIYDVQGRLVARLLDDEQRAAGSHSVRWVPESGAGVYFVRLETPHGSASRKLLRVP
jgi:hypothetical protein